MKTGLCVIIAALWSLLVLGISAPALISSASTIDVWLGLLLIVVGWPYILYQIWIFWRKTDESKWIFGEKDDDTNENS